VNKITKSQTGLVEAGLSHWTAAGRAEGAAVGSAHRRTGGLALAEAGLEAEGVAPRSHRARRDFQWETDLCRLCA
jgi:hypothetical protein